MAESVASLQDDLDEVLDDVTEVKGLLNDVYQPESAREEMAAAIGKALDILDSNESDDDDEEGDDYEQD